MHNIDAVSGDRHTDYAVPKKRERLRNMANLQGRLRQAIRLSRFPSIRKFAAAFDESGRTAGIRGYSAPVLQRHLDGRGEPPDRQWLEVFADVAGVRLDWLVTGQGPRTDIEERAGFYDIALLAGADVARTMGDPGVILQLRGVFGRLLASLPDEPTGDQQKELVRMLEDALQEPMRAVAPHQPGKPTPIADPDRWRTYTTLILAAMDVAMRPPGENVTADKLLARWKLYSEFDDKTRGHVNK